MITEEQFYGAKILIVDDEPANIRMLETFLNAEGYLCIKSITDSRETLDSYQEYQPDLVLLDLNMPHLTGMEILEQFNDLEQKYQVPVMVLTAQIDLDSRIKALALGARDFLSKPFDLIELKMRIKNLLEVRLLIGQLYEEQIVLEEKLERNSFELAVAMTKIKDKK